MGHKIVADKFQMDEMRTKYGPRKGLEGPFNFSGRVLYYDNTEGLYYDQKASAIARGISSGLVTR